MNKRTILIIAFVLSLGLLFCYFKFFYGWIEFRKNTDTPNGVLSYVEIKKSDYSRDSIRILTQLRLFLALP